MEPLRISVVGHVNTGKTSLIATLSRRSDLAIGDGRTTVKVQEITFSCRGETLLVLVDTPGFEMLSDIVDALEQARLKATAAGKRRDDLELLEEFLAGARESGDPDLKLDVRALDAALGSDVIFYVVDVTQEPLERLRDEVGLLVRTARPVVGVLNFTAEPDTFEADWREVFRREKVHAMAAFDVMVNDVKAERELYQTMATVVVADRRAAVPRLEEAQKGEAMRQRQLAIRAAATMLLDIVTIQVERPAALSDAEDDARHQLEARVQERERAGLTALGQALGFDGDEVTAGATTAEAEVLRDGLFDPEALKRHGPGLLTLAAGGAAVGVSVDLAFGVASLGLGTVIGGTVGLVGGFLRRAVKIQRRGEQVLARVRPELSWLLLARLTAAYDAYRRRTHARKDVVDLAHHDPDPLRKQPGAAGTVAVLTKAQKDPNLTDPERLSPRVRAERLADLERELGQLLP